MRELVSILEGYGIILKARELTLFSEAYSSGKGEEESIQINVGKLIQLKKTK